MDRTKMTREQLIAELRDYMVNEIKEAVNTGNREYLDYLVLKGFDGLNGLANGDLVTLYANTHEDNIELIG